MVDTVDKATRSRMMKSVRGRDTKPEIALRKALHASGLRYRLQHKGLPGRPDIVLVSARIACLVHGCFWHRHANCKHARLPNTNVDLWGPKFLRNSQRDEWNVRDLLGQRWRVVIVWECALRGHGAAGRIAQRIHVLAKKDHAPVYAEFSEISLTLPLAPASQTMSNLCRRRSAKTFERG